MRSHRNTQAQQNKWPDTIRAILLGGPRNSEQRPVFISEPTLHILDEGGLSLYKRMDLGPRLWDDVKAGRLCAPYRYVEQR